MAEKQETCQLSRSHNGDQSHRKVRIGIGQVLVAAFAFILAFLFTAARLLSYDNAAGVGKADYQRDGKRRTQLRVPFPPANHDSDEGIANAMKTSDKYDKNSFHFIVSSDCTSYQRWETLTQLHSAQNVRQCGRFTWIVSGCLAEGSERNGKGKGGANSDILTPSLLLEEVERHFPHLTVSNHTIATGTGRSVSLAQDHEDCSILHPHVHFTPDFSDMSVYGGPYADGKTKRVFINRQGDRQGSNFGNTYKFNNKPNGLYHWIVDFLAHDDRRDEAIVLVDPDFLFLTRFDFPEDVAPAAPGKPVAAKYGLGGQVSQVTIFMEYCHLCHYSLYSLSL